MCYPGEAPIRQYDGVIAHIENDLTSLANTGDHVAENLPPAFLDLNSATEDMPAAEANALRRYELGALILPTARGVFASQRPPRDLQLELRIYFSYVTSPQMLDRETKDVRPPSSSLLRRLLRSLPQRLTLASWVSRMLISSAKSMFFIPGMSLRVPDEAKYIRLVSGSHALDPHNFQRMQSYLEHLPLFLAHLTVKFAEWLPFELQMLDDDRTPQEFRLAYHNSGPEYFLGLPASQEVGENFSIYVLHALEFLQNRGWFDLPFADDLEGRFHDTIDGYVRQRWQT
ncbi:MAG: hypothetical protein FRX48_04946 [Lasallia pustulata]|uniref:Uncharacterized protein n=1 Tax=Lasallia pustulata TaxID=136370 RepID=A0A5M8PRT7_9LECA|nr:MAG: hypothetical protein FRX48_04946 [Lasallia pustulata]